MQELPDTSNLAALVAPYAKGNGYVVPLTDRRGVVLGNNGDFLMAHAFREICRDLGLRLGAAAAADYVVVPPNGALLDRFLAPDLIAERLEEFSDRPVIIFPSSAQFESRDPSFMFRGRIAPTLWILRELYSLQNLKKKWGAELAEVGVTLALDHDVVVTGSAHVRKLLAGRGTDAAKSKLLVARMGIEAQDMRSGPDNARSVHAQRAGGAGKRALVRIARTLPDTVLRPVRRRRVSARQRVVNERLVAGLPANIREELAGHVDGQWDISDKTLFGYDDFLADVAGADLIVSNRLHVAIPGALLGKRVVIVDSGYHKLRGIYEHSLASLENIDFLARE